MLTSVRDLVHNLTHWETTPGHVADTLLNAAGSLPGAGMVQKAGQGLMSAAKGAASAAAASKAAGAAENLGARAGNAAASAVQGEAKGGAYLLRDPKSGQPMRSGRTKDMLRRKGDHARDPALKDLDFDPIYPTDIYAEQRGLEQYLHDTLKPPLNKINPISPNNPNLKSYLNAAKRYLNKLGGR